MKRKVVRAIIIVDNNLVTLFRRKNNIEYYSLPGGGIKKNETPFEALHRELKEELNIKIKINKKAFIYENANQVETFYECDYLEGSFEIVGEEKYRNSATNYYEIKFLPIREVDNYQLLPIIKDYLKIKK